MRSPNEQLLAILAALEECRTALVAGGHRETAHLVSVASLDLRMKLNRLGDADLKALSDEMVEMADDRARARAASETRRGRPLLRLVK